MIRRLMPVSTQLSYRTDTIMILFAQPLAGTATLISFPRDLYVYIPAYTMQRINVAFPIGYTLGYEGGSFGLFQDTMMYNFGLRVDHWVRVNFSGFTGLVDSLGGIDVPVGQTLIDKRKGFGVVTVYPGVVHMDGATALWYVRSRYSTSDFDRERRQQEVILGFANRLLSLNALANMPGFFDQLRQFVDMDLSFQDLAPFVSMATSCAARQRPAVSHRQPRSVLRLDHARRRRRPVADTGCDPRSVAGSALP